MKITTIALCVFCLLLTNFKSRAAGNCYTNWGTATCEANYGQYSSDTFEYTGANSGLTLVFWAYLGGTTVDYQAYAYAGWTTSGPSGYYYYAAGSTSSPYVFDGLALGGWLNLNAYTQGLGSSAGVTATW